jgi:hypothetical protein
MRKSDRVLTLSPWNSRDSLLGATGLIIAGAGCAQILGLTLCERRRHRLWLRCEQLFSVEGRRHRLCTPLERMSGHCTGVGDGKSPCCDVECVGVCSACLRSLTGVDDGTCAPVPDPSGCVADHYCAAPFCLPKKSDNVSCVHSYQCLSNKCNNHQCSP